MVEFFTKNWLFLRFSILICVKRKIFSEKIGDKIDVEFFVEFKSELVMGVWNEGKPGNRN